MKKNDIIALVLAMALLVGIGYYYLSQNAPKKSAGASGTQVEVAPVIANNLDPDNTVQQMPTTYKVQDFKKPVVITGLGNPAPFASQ